MRNACVSALFRALFLCLLMATFFSAEAQRRSRGSDAEESKSDRRKREKEEKEKEKKEKALSRAEEKQWKSKLKGLTPEKYKNLMTEYYGLEDRVSKLQQEVSSCEETALTKDERLKKYGAKLKEASAVVSSVKKQRGQRPALSPAKELDNSGVFFKVQIGAYKNMDLSQYSGQENFGMDRSGDINKYMIGAFRDYREADDFKKYLRNMGLKDAWVVAYRDGSRVEVNEVIQGR